MWAEYVANLFAQISAFSFGNQAEDFKRIPGNKQNLLLLFGGELDAFNLGVLDAICEWRVVVEGFLMEINSFDQFGVELGKLIQREKVGQGGRTGLEMYLEDF